MAKILWTPLIILLLFSYPAWGGSLSFSTDFDGTGSGSGFRINSPNIGSSSHGPRSSPESSTSDQEFIKRRYEEQLREAQKRAQEEELKRQMEIAKKRADFKEVQRLLNELRGLEKDAPSIRERMKYKEQVLDLEKKYEQARRDYMAALPSYRQRLAWSIDRIDVPPPLTYRRILILGLWNTPEEAEHETAREDAFTGKEFSKIFAFGTKGPSDLIRVGLDHLLGHFNMLSPETARQIGELKGAHVDELVCHSNGYRIAEVLISTGMLNVRKLRILGGDNVIWDLDRLQKLKDEKNLEEVSVYLTKGDVVPIINVGWKIIDFMGIIGRPLESFQEKRNDPSYQIMGITAKPKFDPEAKVQVHILSYPAASGMNFIERHKYKNYARILKGWRMSNCLNEDGTMNQRCIIY